MALSSKGKAIIARPRKPFGSINIEGADNGGAMVTHHPPSKPGGPWQEGTKSAFGSISQAHAHVKKLMGGEPDDEAGESKAEQRRETRAGVK